MSANHDRARCYAPRALAVILLALGTATAWADGSVTGWGDNGYGQCDVPLPNDNFAAISAGYLHNLGRKPDGSIVAWGDNTLGQCSLPTPNSGFTAVAAGGYHSLALKTDGSIVTWGSNTYHQCDVPAPNADFVAIAAGYQHSLGLKFDGRIIAWGDNAFGQCNGPADNAGFVALAAGFYHSLGLKADGLIAAWGDNRYGQCTLPSPNSGFVAVAAGEGHSLGLKTDGSIAAWGSNGWGQCTIPTPNSGFVTLAAGQAHSLALRADCTTAAWGWNAYGQCTVPAPNAGGVSIAAGGYHSLMLRVGGSPEAASGPNPPDAAISVAVVGALRWSNATWASSYDVYFGTTNPPPLAGTAQSNHWRPPSLACSTTYYWQVIARNCNGTNPAPIWTFSTTDQPPQQPAYTNPPAEGTDISLDADLRWTPVEAESYDVYFGLTDTPPLAASTNAPSWAPTLEGGLRWYWQVAAKNVCAATTGQVWAFTTQTVPPFLRAWGYNSSGECNVPAPNADFVAVAAGESHNLGLKADGSIVAWGGNTEHQCNVPLPNGGFVAVAANNRRSLALKDDGSILAWGANSHGESNVPVPNADFVAIAAGYDHNLGLKADGSIVSWGDGPGNPPGPNTGFTAMAGGYYFSLGLQTDGSIVAWGDNRYGQCDVPTPNSGFVAVAAGFGHSLGLKADGSVVAWGDDRDGRCNVPAPNSGFVGIAAGYSHSLGLKADGSIVGWGYNASGQCNAPSPNAGYIAIAGGGYHSIGLKSGGMLPVFVGSPTPADGAIGVTVGRITLHWPRVDLATNYDLHFGTTNPPPLLATTWADFWVLPPRACGTTYYWQVVARNRSGTIPGPVWTFSTTDQPPDPPAEPSPSDGAVDVAPETDLEWADSAGVISYDVYFGVTNPPPLVGTTEASSWPLPSLVCWTTYYWQIVPRNCAGASSGPVWSFHTRELPPPELPAGPTPPDGAIDVATDTVLEWSDAGLVSYDVYLGLTNPPPLVGNTSTPRWVPTLEPGFRWYWQIVAKNDCGTEVGPVWSFDTQAAPPFIRVWGLNNHGECNVPIPNAEFVAIAAGSVHVLGLKADGSIVAWGANDYDQCSVPPPNSDFIDIAAGRYYSLGLKRNGSIVAWGDDRSLQCEVPTPNAGFVAIAAGSVHGLGLKTNGSIVAWGDNTSGQCNVPAPNTGFVAVAAGTRHSFGLKSDGSIVAWGRNDYGQCNVPAPNTGFVAAAGGGLHSLGLKSDGQIIVWGDNSFGQCDGPEVNSGFVRIAAGLSHCLGLRGDGSIVAWGDNNGGKCNVPSPNAGFIAISAGEYHSVGLKSGGTLPAQVGSPTPSDGDLNVALATARLDWPDAHWATSYDVYFGTTNPPALVGSTVTSHWALPPLVGCTTYYWRVESRNCSGTTPGLVWTFTTGVLPAAPAGARPSDGMTADPCGGMLTWVAAGATSYDVYLGVTNPPPFVGTTTTPAWARPPGAGPRRYWKVVAKNTCGSTPGPVWSFDSSGLCRGDLNCDGVVSFADINPFVNALSDLSAWQEQFPTCPWQHADVNGDGVVSFADINPFVSCLAHGGCP